MRVRVNETGYDDSPGGVNDFTIGVNHFFDLASRAGLNDASVANEHCAVVDDPQFAHFSARTRAPWPGQRHKLRSPDDGKRSFHKFRTENVAGSVKRSTYQTS